MPHDYNKKIPKKKKCRKRWRGGLKETIELMLIRPPQLQFFEDGIKITATIVNLKSVIINRIKSFHYSEGVSCRKSSNSISERQWGILE